VAHPDCGSCVNGPGSGEQYQAVHKRSEVIPVGKEPDRFKFVGELKEPQRTFSTLGNLKQP
jgi:hypothetical protein